MSYVVVVNRPNNVATVHQESCAHLQGAPLRQTASAERYLVPDGLDALVVAVRSGKGHTSLCGHCLRDAAGLVSISAR